MLLWYFETGFVPRLPTAILAMGLVIIGVLSLTAGVVLDSVTNGRRELRRLRSLDIPLFRSMRGT